MLKKIVRKVRDRLQRRRQRLFWEEREYPGLPPKIYVIRRQDANVGLFSYFITHLGAIKKAVDSGYIPVVDMMTYTNTYLSEEQVGQENAWEAFFEQPCGYDLAHIHFHRRLISSGIIDYPFPSLFMQPESEECRQWKQYAERYIKIAPQITRAVEEAYRQIIPEGKRVLGVLCRGTDYLKLRPHEHPVQPSVEMMMQKVCACLQEWNCEYIYLATEDREICEAFQQKFGDHVLYRMQDKIDYTENTYLINYLPHSTSGKIRQGQDYLISIGILTKCNALVAGRTSGSIGALLLPNRFEKVYLWDLGIYE